MKQEILSYSVYSGSPRQCGGEIAEVIRSSRRDCRWLACLNPHSYVVSKSDLLFQNALRAADWLVPDGVGIVLAGQVLGRRVPGRITGSDIFSSVMRTLHDTSGSVFFLGSTEDTLALIRDRMRVEYPSIRLAGTYSPPFKDSFTRDEIQRMIDMVNASGADVLWLGMTAPKQERWLFANRDRLNVSFAGAIGAVFDFYAGRVPRSHPVFQGLGLEWLPRLLRQPRRLWRRMAVSAPIFLFDLGRVRMGLQLNGAVRAGLHVSHDSEQMR